MGNFVKIIGGIVALFIGLIFMGMVLTGTSDLLAWTGGGLTVADFTGFEAIAKMLPLLALLALVGGVALSFFGVKGFMQARGGGGKARGGKH